ncbi:hypothetical protein COB52_01435 [Candidatus Kaiserbacteria bacterium]|nr:MAG: hypothetical protein COB52_01435 [Candidatus Kaiserbacteria bacterium]
MTRINVGVLRGGPSNEYDISLITGATVLENLPEEKYNVKDILISKNGEWHSRGIPVNPEKALRGIDVVFNALHGEYGEDGEVQKLLDAHRVPYTGSGVFASSLAMNKAKAHSFAKNIPGIRVPEFLVVRKNDSLKEAAQKVFAQFGPKYIVKPLRGGSSLGIAIAESVSDLPRVLSDAFESTDSVIVEQFISGKEGTCGVVNDFRDSRVYALPPVEIRHTEHFWSYDSKYDDSTEEICPANFSTSEKKIIEEASIAIHEALGLEHYSRSDFIITPSGIYFLETNTLPGLAPACLLPKALDAVGVSVPDFLDHVVTLAIKKG